MSWIGRFRPLREATLSDAGNATVTHGSQPEKAIRSNADCAAVPGESVALRAAEEIKRRQISLTVRYVAAVRSINVVDKHPEARGREAAMATSFGSSQFS
jgi:hypothetical protein